MADEERDRFFRIGEVVVDRERNCLLRDGEAVRLEPRLVAVLEHLAAAGGRTVSREELVREVWRAHVVDEAVHRAISLLRAALGDDARSPRLIETLPGKGYRLLVGPEAVREVGAAPATRLTLSGRGLGLAALAGLAGLAVGAAVAAAVLPAREEPAYAPVAPAAQSTASAEAPPAP